MVLDRILVIHDNGNVKTLPLSEVKANLSKLVTEVSSRDERVTITRNGRPAAILVSPEDFESWQATIEIMSDAEFMKDIRRGLRDLKRGKTRTYEEVFGRQS